VVLAAVARINHRVVTPKLLVPVAVILVEALVMVVRMTAAVAADLSIQVPINKTLRVSIWDTEALLLPGKLLYHLILVVFGVELE
jgi:hypothetical protein